MAASIRVGSKSMIHGGRVANERPGFMAPLKRGVSLALKKAGLMGKRRNKKFPPLRARRRGQTIDSRPRQGSRHLTKFAGTVRPSTPARGGDIAFG